MLRKVLSLPVVGAILMTLNGCSSHEEPFLTVQACVEDDKAFVAAFPSLTAEIASKYDLSVIDHSAETERQLEDIKTTGGVDTSVSQTVNLGLFRGNRVKVMVGNLGLSHHDILISFFGNASDEEDRALSGDVVRALRQHWPVETVPTGESPSNYGDRCNIP